LTVTATISDGHTMVNDGHSNDGHKELMRATNDDSDGLNNDGHTDGQ